VNAIFCGCVRNSSQHLEKIFRNIEYLSSIFDKSHYLFVENDSIDQTVSLLSEWGDRNPRFKLLTYKGLDAIRGSRTQRLAFCRNIILQEVRSPGYSDYDYVIMLDMDEVNSAPIDSKGVRSALSFLMSSDQIGAVTAWQEHYYDLWALREHVYFPIDIWERCLAQSLLDGLSDSEIYRSVAARYSPSFISNSEPTEVTSAFGGLAIYKRSALLSSPVVYCGERDLIIPTPSGYQFAKIQQCEHVSLHFGMVSFGHKIFIHPSLVNSSLSSAINPSFFRSILIQ
jgi:hypothetical protein